MDLVTEQRTQRSTEFRPLLVGVIGFVLMAYISFGLLAESEWNPTVFIKFGTESGELKEYGASHFDEVIPSGTGGHDGKFFFIQAADPFYLHPDDHAHLLDRPTYRAQRMLYPTLAGGFGLFPSEITAWSLILVNLVGVGVGTYLTARVATELGINSLFGLAFFANPAVFVSAVIDSAEVFAMVFLMAGLLMAMRRRVVPAALLFTLSALSRETMLVSVAGWILFELFRRRRVEWIMGLPFGAVGAWWLFLRLRIGYLSGDIQDTAALGPPMDGFIQSLQQWLGTSAHLDDAAIGLALLLVGVFFAFLAVRRMSLIPLMASGFLVLGIFMVQEVWTNYFDAARALTPLLTLFVLSLPFTLRGHPDGFV